MFRRSLIPGALAALTLAFVPPAGAQQPPAAGAPTVEAAVAGRRLVLPVPPGMCALQRDLAADREAFAARVRSLEQRGTPLAVSVPCDRLAAIRLGSHPIGPLAIVLSPHDVGGLPSVAVVPRAEFLRSLEISSQTFDFAAAIAAHNQRISGRDGLAVERASVVERDDHAIYLGILATTRGRNDATEAVAAVAGLTVVQDAVVIHYQHDRYDHRDRSLGEATLRRLVAEARASVAALIAANPQPSAAAAASVEVEMAGRQLVLPVPPGMCALQRDLAAHREAFAAQARDQGPAAELLGVFVTCDQLVVLAFRGGGAELYLPYAMVVAARDRGGVRTVGSRAEFLRRVAARAPKLDLALAGAEINRLRSHAGFADMTLERAGMVDRDDQAIYMVSVTKPRGANDAAAVQSGAEGMTVVQDIVVIYRHIDQVVDETSLPRLVSEARASVAALIAANP